MADSIQAKVRADLEERERIGIERYGTALHAHNGRDALRDAYEEALDLCCYLRQAMEERKGAREQYRQIVEINNANEAAYNAKTDALKARLTNVYHLTINYGDDPAGALLAIRRESGPGS